MKTVGLITEYNPFHLGHKYHIRRSKELTGADTAVVLMSGNYVQRGTPAIFDKYLRAEVALHHGADLVLELPSLFSTASAEGFARGAVFLLEKSGVIDTLCFGSETGSLDDLKEIAKILSLEPEDYRSILKRELALGLSFPIARQKAFQEYGLEHHLTLDASLLSSPNNLLGIEYLKALFSSKSSITPFCLPRIHAGYHDTEEKHRFYSASALRGIETVNLREFQNSLTDIDSAYFGHIPLHFSDFSQILGEKLLSEMLYGDFSSYLDVSDELANILKKSCFSYQNVTDFLTMLKTKNYTHTRISRVLLHLLLGIRKEDFSLAFAKDTELSHVRVLGYTEKGKRLLGKINQNLSLIMKPASDIQKLDEANLSIFKLGLYGDMLYRMAAMQKSQAYIPTEYERKILYQRQ